MKSDGVKLNREQLTSTTRKSAHEARAGNLGNDCSRTEQSGDCRHSLYCSWYSQSPCPFHLEEAGSARSYSSRCLSYPKTAHFSRLVNRLTVDINREQQFIKPQFSG